MTFLAWHRTHRHSGVFAKIWSRLTTEYTPTKFSWNNALIVWHLDLNVVLVLDVLCLPSLWNRCNRDILLPCFNSLIIEHYIINHVSQSEWDILNYVIIWDCDYLLLLLRFLVYVIPTHSSQLFNFNPYVCIFKHSVNGCSNWILHRAHTLFIQLKVGFNC